MKSIFCILLVLSTFQVKHDFTGQPEWLLWGNPDFITYDAERHVWVNKNTQIDSWRLGNNDLTKPEEVPEKQQYLIVFKVLFLRQDDVQYASIGVFATQSKRRFGLINVEESINEMKGDATESRVWPHLGLLYIGTVADQEGWQVSLHDELVQGYVDLEQFVQPGDIVGLSLVVTGMERGIELARQAKRLGARYVIAGNDSAIFRSDQILALPGKPIDGVFTSNSLTAVRQFFQQIESADISELVIDGVSIVPSGLLVSNEVDAIKKERMKVFELRKKGEINPQDVFVVPKLDLYSKEYWKQVWTNYRKVFGHKHQRPNEVRNGLALFAQGCTRAASMDVCSYCTIAGVADIRIPEVDYLASMLQTYQDFGIDYVFNATDSALEMKSVCKALKALGANFSEGLMIYGRAWGLSHHPEAIDEWLSLTGGRLLVNVGMDSGDERILQQGIGKASKAGSRLEENRQAVRNVKSSGAHLHYSLIFGSPGETRESCERSMEFFEWSRSELGTQLDQCETDIYWLNHGSPASRVLRDYQYAVELAACANKLISISEWNHYFHQYRDTLVVPWEVEEAWFKFFTSITVEEAQAYNAQVSSAMARHEGAAPGRLYKTAFKPS